MGRLHSEPTLSVDITIRDVRFVETPEGVSAIATVFCGGIGIRNVQVLDGEASFPPFVEIPARYKTAIEQGLKRRLKTTSVRGEVCA